MIAAHGLSPAVREEAKSRGLRVIDATCPMVAKVHGEARLFAEMGYQILLIGEAAGENVGGSDHGAPLPAFARSERHLLDEPQVVAVPERPPGEADCFVVVQAAEQHSVDLDRGQADGGGRRQAGPHVGRGSPSGGPGESRTD